MIISLTKEQDKAADTLVKAGIFSSKDEAVAHSHEWLRKEAEKLEAIRAAIKESEEQSARGELRPIDPDELMQRVLKRLEEENTASPPP